ncbi:MAG: hypothetical protein RJA98_1771, partial [Pseudomonadota bacterium]
RQLDEIGERLKQMQTDLGSVKTGVAQANDKLDKLASAVDPNNPSDRCPDLECAVLGNASVATVQKLVKNGARLPGVPQMGGMFVMGALSRPVADREALLALLLRAGLDPQVLILAQTSDSQLINAQAMRIADEVLQRIGDAVPGVGQSAVGGASVGNWNKLASCLFIGNEGISLSELAALLGDSQLMKQALRLGFSRPRPTLSCSSLRLHGGSATIVIDPAGNAKILNG